ncbi:putative odorant receptor 19b [Schistocerca serialis cubense]|uniref:putative odorant receptor 19b n=1 Tax=Schistocerca serialis cubense TaxID=2023355 RepID=UPI00214EFA54|nr:putative odorant receptor 19b [Schistocerca serialis cubense]
MSSLALNARILRVAGLWPDLGSRLSTAYTALAAAFQSEDLKWAAYSCNWQGAPRSFTDLLKIVMLWAQQPLILSAGKYYRISLKTFVTVATVNHHCLELDFFTRASAISSDVPVERLSTSRDKGDFC